MEKILHFIPRGVRGKGKYTIFYILRRLRQVCTDRACLFSWQIIKRDRENVFRRLSIGAAKTFLSALVSIFRFPMPQRSEKTGHASAHPAFI